MLPSYTDPVTAALNVYSFPAQVNPAEQIVSVDLGNALPISDGDGSLLDIGKLSFALLKDDRLHNGANIDSSQIALLGNIPYQSADWYKQTAAVIDFDYSVDEWVQNNIDQQPLALLKSTGSDQYQIMVRESGEGLYVRADNFVQRLNPGEQVNIDFYASRYGQPYQGDIQLSANNSGSGKPLNPPVKIPDAGIPSDAISYSPTISTNAGGFGSLIVSTSSNGPGNPRDYIDGQVYGIGYQLADQPMGYDSNPWLFVSLLVWDQFTAPSVPTWYDDIQVILQQYGNLYPIMSRHLVDLGDYQR